MGTDLPHGSFFVQLLLQPTQGLVHWLAFSYTYFSHVKCHSLRRFDQKNVFRIAIIFRSCDSMGDPRGIPDECQFEGRIKFCINIPNKKSRKTRFSAASGLVFVKKADRCSGAPDGIIRKAEFSGFRWIKHVTSIYDNWTFHE